MSILALLAVLFVALKLTGVIAWSWIWVLAPLLPTLIIYSVIFISWLFAGVVMLAAFLKK